MMTVPPLCILPGTAVFSAVRLFISYHAASRAHPGEFAGLRPPDPAHGKAPEFLFIVPNRLQLQ